MEQETITIKGAALGVNHNLAYDDHWSSEGFEMWALLGGDSSLRVVTVVHVEPATNTCSPISVVLEKNLGKDSCGVGAWVYIDRHEKEEAYRVARLLLNAMPRNLVWRKR